MKQNSEKVILYLSKHFRKKIKLEEIAKIAGLSSFYFHRKFVEENNCTPQNYLENIRMQHASHIIDVYPNWALTDVAFECGYSSPGIFSRAFKKYYGITPSKYKLKTIDFSENIDSKKTKPIQIQYLSQKKIRVEKVSLFEKNLTAAYQKLINSSDSSTHAFGFFLDIPFHDIPLKECRYFMGVETSNSDKNTSVLTIPSGYYTTISIQGIFKQLKERLVAINQQIRNNGYVIDSLTGYEKISIAKKTSPFNYMESAREIFIKIKRE